MIINVSATWRMLDGGGILGQEILKTVSRVICAFEASRELDQLDEFESISNYS